MSTQIEAELKDILSAIERKLDKIDERLSKLEIGQARLEEKMDGFSERMDNQEFLSRGAIIGLIFAIAGGAAKLFGFVSNP